MEAESRPADHETEKKDHDEKREKRTSRACLTCRKRKSACDLPVLDGVTTTPCKRCKTTGQECVIGSSNRGGRRERRKTHQSISESADGEHVSWQTSARSEQILRVDKTQHGADEPLYSTSNLGDNAATQPVANAPLHIPTVYLDPALSAPVAAGGASGLLNTVSSGVTRDSTPGSGMFSGNDLQNPSDALGILAQIASNGDNANSYYYQNNDANTGANAHVIDYPLVRDGRLSVPKIGTLMQRYKLLYHPYFPIVPATALDISNLAPLARDESHLLTAILVIASRDLVDDPNVFVACTEHMRALVSALSAGGPSNVACVEALLLLAEWAPYTSRSDAGHVGRGEEDREAWMHVGIALRIGYFLGLDRYSFAVRGDDVRDPQWQRKRLVWTSCYISDRQISIRLGRAFWSRGPGPLTTLRKEDFPMLAPLKPGDEDHASIFQATLELTLLFSNVHDVLYSNPGNSMRSHLSGGYIKYIDDFRSAIYGWKSVWGTLTCSPALKASLLMSYDYLRLYTVAFAFHMNVMQISNDKRSSNPAPGRVFYNNVGAVGDARFIYEGLDAAKSLLSMVNTFVDPEQSLRYMPLRFYLYSIYSGVFLYRARCVGVLAADEETSVRVMIQETVNRLERSGLGPQHPGSRYSRLLRLLWDKVERKDRKERANTATLQNPYRPGSISGAPTSVGALSQDSPALTEPMGEFSWTDLDAIGNFAVNGGSAAIANEAEWWSGFLPADSTNFLFDTLPGMDDWSAGLQ
ncbi:hypothetical protein B0A48_16851 [Cryoendolithus antarcticus]|uniref:Zn(2)-C6 fungal-type domain-containing protein n=1 Tax=Cryoendolithus antarcticus TaxID=1507870 RepID=A0A1V8SDC6_9PEZI|nr:hypothetical protein B0A48_16851 [Cryoendolithus antarcticus]